MSDSGTIGSISCFQCMVDTTKVTPITLTCTVNSVIMDIVIDRKEDRISTVKASRASVHTR